MDNFIALSVKESNESDDLPRIWYRALRETLPDGLLDNFANGDHTSLMKRRVTNGRTILTVKLVRNVTERETKAVANRLGTLTDIDFTVSSSVLEMNIQQEIDVKIDGGLARELALKWAKADHEKWMKKAQSNGWEYGVKVSRKEKRHPLIRAFDDLPEKYRKADTSRIEEFMELINESGYIIVSKMDIPKPKSKS